MVTQILNIISIWVKMFFIINQANIINMKVSIFTTMTNPEERMDPWKEALNCYESIADEVIVVGADWPEEFKWDHIGKTFNQGLEQCSGDWVINLSLDMFIHEKDISKLIGNLKKHQEYPAVAFPKNKFFTPYRFQVKAFEACAINKKIFPEVRFGGGGDLCLPILGNTVLNQNNVPISRTPLWNYDTTFRTKEIIAHDRARFARAWNRQFNDWGDRGGGTPEEAFDAWFSMIKLRLKSQTRKAKLEHHPKYIQDKLAKLESNQFGYDCFGEANKNSPGISDYIEASKIRVKFKI